MAARQYIAPGTEYGCLTFVCDVPNPGGFRRARFDCACGRTVDTWLGPVREGRVVSCGCHRTAKTVERSTTHGDAKRGSVSTEYRTWTEMKKRCMNPTHRFYKHYGGRGIAVCERWSSFDCFLADMGRKPSPSHSIERIDNDKGYGPGNCRWATKTEQANNRRVTPFVTYKGKTQTIKQWADELGFKYWSLRNRIVNLGWPIERAMETPAIVGRNQFG